MNKKLLIFWAAVVGAVFLAHHFSGFLEDMVVAGKWYAWGLLFVWYYIWIRVIATLVNKYLKVLK